MTRRVVEQFSALGSPVTSPPAPLPAGFRFGSAAGGIKASGRPDVAVIVTDAPAVAGAVTTRNQIVAAPVLWCRARTPTANFRALAINSGNANACTGQAGAADNAAMAAAVARHVGCNADSVLTMSTGIIGVPMPMPAVKKGIDAACENLSATEEAFAGAAAAILTTDSGPKTVRAAAGKHRIAAIAKGAGMIAPNMATMLGAILTDAPIAESDVGGVLKRITQTTFNRVSVDGHTSTNDTLVLVATGTGTPLRGHDLAAWETAATEAAATLAKKLVADGEGATRCFEVLVVGAKSERDAETIARTVAASPLVKTAIAGADPNWGRIVSAAGYAGPAIDVAATGLKIQGITVFADGGPVPFNASEISYSMQGASEVRLELSVGKGAGQASFWASDLDEAYVRFNSKYTT